METHNSHQRGLLRLTLFALLLIVVCSGISYLTAYMVMHEREWNHDQPQGHQWLKKELNLTSEEGDRIDAYEADYRLKRKQLQAQFDDKIASLGLLIRKNDAYTQEVAHGVHQLHEVHGQLQQLSIEHYYEMLSVLSPDKQALLSDLAVEALSQPE